jgi:hypothetical protein
VFTVREFLEDFSPEILCCGVLNGKLLLGTNEGLYLVEVNRNAEQQSKYLFYIYLLFCYKRYFCSVFMSSHLISCVATLYSTDKITKINTKTKKSTQYTQIEIVPQYGIVVTLLGLNQIIFLLFSLAHTHSLFASVYRSSKKILFCYDLAKVGIVVYDIDTLEEPTGPNELELERTKDAYRFALGSIPPSANLALWVYRPKGFCLYKWESDSFQLNQVRYRHHKFDH